MLRALESVPVDYGGPVDRPFEPFPRSTLAGSITDRFSQTVRRFPERVAVSDRTCSLSYAELAGLVDRIAVSVDTAAAERPGPVVILLGRDVLLPAAILGVLAAGRAYVPLDANGPIERNQLIARQSGAAAVVSVGDLARQVRGLFLQDG